MNWMDIQIYFLAWLYVQLLWKIDGESRPSKRVLEWTNDLLPPCLKYPVEGIIWDSEGIPQRQIFGDFIQLKEI